LSSISNTGGAGTSHLDSANSAVMFTGHCILYSMLASHMQSVAMNLLNPIELLLSARTITSSSN